MVIKNCLISHFFFIYVIKNVETVDFHMTARDKIRLIMTSQKKIKIFIYTLHYFVLSKAVVSRV